MWNLTVYYRDGQVRRFELPDEQLARAKSVTFNDRAVQAIELYGPNGEYDGWNDEERELKNENRDIDNAANEQAAHEAMIDTASARVSGDMLTTLQRMGLK